ncbi:hypothetical protein MPSEU_000952400 [Mayamaea pseudoterrestris]|nr:hypothetical protein MPSEU_000952400 [Mayamaea pseudoterrestris]
MSTTQTKTILDRSLPLQLTNPDDTPSRRRGISAHVERLHRIHGISLMRSAWDMLLPNEHKLQSSSGSSESPKFPAIPISLKASALHTSSTLLHRYYHNVSLHESNVWSIAMACTLLAAKLLEVANTADVRKVITVYAHLYRRRIMQAVAGADKCCHMINSTPTSLAASLRQPGQKYTQESIKAFLLPPGMSPAGPVYQEWSKALVEAEHKVLCALGFLLHWIPNQMPQKYLGPMLLMRSNGRQKDIGATALESISSDAKDLVQRAWGYCNDAHYLDLATRIPPHLICVAAIYVAHLDRGSCFIEDLNEWMRKILGTAGNANDVSVVCNALLGFHKHVASEHSEVWMAAHGFLKSLESDEGSFNDPSSFVWEMEEVRWTKLSGGDE